MEDLIVPAEILPHPFRPDTERIFALGVQRDTSKDHGDKPVISVIGTNESEDRHGSVIRAGGLDVSSYLRNPVVLWAHKNEVPAIGKTVNLKRVGSRWEFDIEFLVDAWEDTGGRNLSKLIYRLMKDDGIRATSISFIPKEWAEREAQNIPSFFAENLEYVRSELTEISPVNVPSNREALQKSLAKGTISEQDIEILGFDVLLRSVKPIVVSSPAKPAPSVALTRAIAAIQRCGDCYEKPVEETVSSEVQAAEIEVMNALASLAMDEINVGLDGWERSGHRELRDLCRWLVEGSMYRYDAIRAWMKKWYAVDLGEEPIVAEVDAVRGFLARAGAVLNKTNKAKLEQIKTLADEVLASAGSKDEEKSKAAPAPVTITDEAEKAVRTLNLFGARAGGSPTPESPKPPATGSNAEGSAAPTPTVPDSYFAKLFQL